MLKVMVAALVLMTAGAASGQTACTTAKVGDYCLSEQELAQANRNAQIQAMYQAPTVPCSFKHPGTVLQGHEDSCLPIAPSSMILPNGNTAHQREDGTIWVSTPAGGVTVQITPAMPVNEFTTNVILNRDTDTVNGAQSDQIQIQGNCSAKTYEIMGAIGFSGANGTGYPIENVSYTDLTDIQGGREIHRVIEGTNIEKGFKIACAGGK